MSAHGTYHWCHKVLPERSETAKWHYRPLNLIPAIYDRHFHRTRRLFATLETFTRHDQENSSAVQVKCTAQEIDHGLSVVVLVLSDGFPEPVIIHASILCKVLSCLYDNNNIARLQSDPQGRVLCNRLGSICIGKWNWLKNVNVNETESNLPVSHWNRFVMMVMVCKTFSFQVRHTSEDVPRDLFETWFKGLLQLVQH